jgi:hypothetical protein
MRKGVARIRVVSRERWRIVGLKGLWSRGKESVIGRQHHDAAVSLHLSLKALSNTSLPT